MHDGRRADAHAERARAGGSKAFLVAGLAATTGVVVLDGTARGWLLTAIAATSALVGAVAARDRRSPGDPAAPLAVGAALLVPAYALWYPLSSAGTVDLPSPGPSDALFLGAYGCFLVGLARAMRRTSETRRRIDVLDTLIVTVGLGVLVWVLFMSPHLDQGTSVPAKAVAMAYPVFALLLTGGAVRMLVQGAVETAGTRLFVGWAVAQLLGDLVYTSTYLDGTFDLEHPAVVLYPVSFVLLGAALLHPTTWARSSAPHRPMGAARRFAMVVPAAAIAPSVLAVLGVQEGNVDVVFVALLAAVLFALVLSRVWFLFVDVEEHRRIRQQLTESVAEERRRSVENQALLASLSERQMLADRLARIQRKISTRAPLQEVLDAITQGAAELVHADTAGLRFVDEDDPSHMVMASCVGVDADLLPSLRRLPVEAGVGGRAIVTNRLCTQEAYDRWEGAIDEFVASGLQTAMAAPVHLDDRPIGSLTVATFDAGRHYSANEQEALLRFADHVSIAINDARSVRAMNEALERATHQATHDALTGLPNRACFYDRTDEVLRHASRTGTSTAVLLFDLDRFKEVNDTLGHRYGDRVLRAIGPRIAPHLRDTDTVARLGGDEFCLLLPDVTDVAAAVEVARRITRALEEPIAVDDLSLVVEASCGVAVAPDHGGTADLLLQRADIAMYEAKRTRQAVATYDDQLDRSTPDRLALVTELRSAIADDQLLLHYQPEVDLGSDRIAGVEALVRWDHPRHGLLSPDRFVPLAEDTGYIHQLTSWVLETALAQLGRWDADPHTGVDDRFSVAVNVSTQSLLDDCFATEVAVALDRYGVRPDRLVLEITETTLMVDPERARRVLTALDELGVRFAIDDFGTGYSSLAALRALPVHELKIDRSFVRGMADDRHGDDAVIVRSVVHLARTLGLRTVAEGVEDLATRDQLAQLGCDRAQGYALAEPMGPEALAAWLRARPVPAVSPRR